MGEVEENAGLNRVRNLLKCASRRVKSTVSGVARWREIFEKYDLDKSGMLGLDELRLAVRKDLRLNEHAVPEGDLRRLFESLDVDGSGTLTFKEFLDYVQRGKRPDAQDDEDMLQQKLVEVQRALRMAMHRGGLRRPWDVSETFKIYDKDGDCRLSPDEMRGFFREKLKLSKYELPDKALRLVFDHLDADKSNSVTVDELVGFLDLYKTQIRQVGGMGYKETSGRSALGATALSSLRGGRGNLGPKLSLAFMALGREHPPHSRLAATGAVPLAPKEASTSSSSSSPRTAAQKQLSGGGRSPTMHGGGQHSSSAPVLPAITPGGEAQRNSDARSARRRTSSGDGGLQKQALHSGVVGYGGGNEGDAFWSFLDDLADIAPGRTQQQQQQPARSTVQQDTRLPAISPQRAGKNDARSPGAQRQRQEMKQTRLINIKRRLEQAGLDLEDIR